MAAWPVTKWPTCIITYIDIYIIHMNQKIVIGNKQVSFCESGVFEHNTHKILDKTMIPAGNCTALSIYLVPFVLQVAHKASTRARQRCRSAETRSRQPHVQPFSFISLSTVLLQVSLGRPLFLWPSGIHRRAILVKAVVCWRSTCPIHHQRLRLTWVEMCSISALRCSSSLVMVFGQ